MPCVSICTALTSTLESDHTCASCTDDDYVALGVLVKILKVTTGHRATDVRLADAVETVVVERCGGCDGCAHRCGDGELLAACLCDAGLAGSISWHGEAFDGCAGGWGGLDGAAAGDAAHASDECSAERHFVSDLQAITKSNVNKIQNILISLLNDLLELIYETPA